MWWTRPWQGRTSPRIPFSVVDQMVKLPLTDIGIEKFLTDWKKLETK